MTRQLAYFAAAYSHRDPRVREIRFRRINCAAAYLMRKGVLLYSPISHTHPIALEGGLPTGWEYWREYDETMLSVCTALCVLQIEGWTKSVGVKAEIEIAERLRLPTYYTRIDNSALDDAARFLKDQRR